MNQPLLPGLIRSGRNLVCVNSVQEVIRVWEQFVITHARRLRRFKRSLYIGTAIASEQSAGDLILEVTVHFAEPTYLSPGRDKVQNFFSIRATESRARSHHPLKFRLTPTAMADRLRRGK